MKNSLKPDFLIACHSQLSYIVSSIRLSKVYFVLDKIFIPSRKNEYFPYVFRRSSLVVYTLFLFIANVVLAGFAPLGATEVGASSITAGTLTAYANQERTAYGLGALSYNNLLAAAAQAKAEDMIAKNYWAHYGPNGESPWQFIAGAGYAYIHAGENLAKGFSTSEGVHQAWMASPTHRANILGGNYQEIGIAVVYGNLQGQDTTLVVQMFGTRAGAQPAPAPTATPNTQPSTGAPYIPPTVPIVDQSGEILSISINSPEEAHRGNQNSISIDGSIETVNSVVKGAYTVEIKNGGVKIGEISSEALEWKYTKPEVWDDGSYNITASVQQGEKSFEDSVNFSIDTAAPSLSQDFLEVTYNDTRAGWQLTLPSLEADELEFSVVLKNEEIKFLKNAENIYELFVTETQLIDSSGTALLKASDDLGNVGTQDIYSRFTKPIQPQIAGTVDGDEGANGWFASLNPLNTFLSLNIRAQFNIIFATSVIILLAFQVYQYKKLNMLASHGGYLLTISAWSFLIVIAMTVGLVGSIV